jgi:hypothetical protein
VSVGVTVEVGGTVTVAVAVAEGDEVAAVVGADEKAAILVWVTECEGVN